MSKVKKSKSVSSSAKGTPAWIMCLPKAIHTPKIENLKVTDLYIPGYQRDEKARWTDRLADVLRAGGHFDPLRVNYRDGRYWLMDGQQRWNAIKKSGLFTSYPCFVYNLSLTDEINFFQALNNTRKVDPDVIVKGHPGAFATWLRSLRGPGGMLSQTVGEGKMPIRYSVAARGFHAALFGSSKSASFNDIHHILEALDRKLTEDAGPTLNKQLSEFAYTLALVFTPSLNGYRNLVTAAGAVYHKRKAAPKQPYRIASHDWATEIATIGKSFQVHASYTTIMDSLWN